MFSKRDYIFDKQSIKCPHQLTNYCFICFSSSVDAIIRNHSIFRRKLILAGFIILYCVKTCCSNLNELFGNGLIGSYSYKKEVNIGQNASLLSSSPVPQCHSGVPVTKAYLQQYHLTFVTSVFHISHRQCIHAWIN